MTAQQLKNAILQEAIQGRLVPQDPNDEPASVLLDKIRKEKQQLVKEGKLKKKDLVEKPILEEEIPFEIPESWEWVRYNDIANCELGKTKNPNDPIVSLCPYLCAINVYWDKIVLTKLKEMPFSESEKDKFSIKKGDMLICEGGEAGRTAIWKEDGKEIYYQNALHRVRFYANIDAYFYMYQMYLYKSAGYLNDYIKGETIQHFVLGKLQSLPVPLPPLAEQKRIVAKIEQLLPKVEEYGKAQEKLNKLNEELPERLKKSILQEAIEGRLVPQDPNDEPAKIDCKQKTPRKISNFDEYLFEIPEKWKWCNLYQVAETLGGYAFQSGDLKSEKGFRVIRISDVTPNGLSNKSVVRCSLKNIPNQYQIKSNDILMAMTGGTVGKSMLIDSLSETMYLNQRVAMIRAKDNINIKYLDLLVKSPLIQTIISDVKNSTNDNISMADIMGFPIPLPPLAEQKRIVEKIEQLFKEIDKLKK